MLLTNGMGSLYRGWITNLSEMAADWLFRRNCIKDGKVIIIPKRVVGPILGFRVLKNGSNKSMKK